MVNGNINGNKYYKYYKYSNIGTIGERTLAIEKIRRRT